MASKIRRDVVILNDFRVKQGRIDKDTLKRQATKTTIEFKAEEIAFDFDPETLGSGPAKAILAMIEDDYSRITKTISANTAKQRKAQARAFAAGKDWAKKRWSGGRIGDTPPDAQSRTWGVNSWRMRHGWFTRLQSKHRGKSGDNTGTPRWFINMPKNRGNTRDFRSTSAFRAFFKELKIQVPALDSAKLVKRKEWREALESGVTDMAAKLTGTRNAKRAQLRRMQLGLAKQVAGLFTGRA